MSQSAPSPSTPPSIPPSTPPPIGCDVLHEDQSVNIHVDVVFVHGLGGHRIQTWSKGTTYWPKDFLPDSVPNARIIAYGYDSRVDGLFTHVSQDTIREHCHTFVQYLLAKRQTDDERHRPIIFVAHSLGGLLVKDTLSYSHSIRMAIPHHYSIFENTCGIVFLGTPHRGYDNKTSLASTITRMLQLFKAPPILEPLKHDSEVLARITEGFNLLLVEKSDIVIYSYHESLPTPGLGIIVNPQSAHLEYAKAMRGSIQADHTNMVKFDRDDPGYELVSTAIRTIVQQPHEQASRRTSMDQLLAQEVRRLEKVVETQKQHLGEEHPNTVSSISNLAAAYAMQGRWQKAEQLQKKVIETQQRLLGENHLDTLSSIHKLASTYWKQGRLTDAEQLQEKVVETRKQELGEEHPDTLSSISDLSATYAKQGRWREAEQLQMKVMETRERVLGEEHPDTLISKAWLVQTALSQGQWTKAEGLQRKVLDTQIRVLGEDHPDTLRSIILLKGLLEEKEKMKEDLKKFF